MSFLDQVLTNRGKKGILWLLVLCSVFFCFCFMYYTQLEKYHLTSLLIHNGCIVHASNQIVDCCCLHYGTKK